MIALTHLALTFGMLSLLAVGGGTAVLPEMQTVLAHQFNIDHTTFVHIYSIGQLAPGPNMMMVLVFGFQLVRLLMRLLQLGQYFRLDQLLMRLRQLVRYFRLENGFFNKRWQNFV